MLNKIVFHKVFGEGKIIFVEERCDNKKIITVDFGEKKAKFVFPDVFSSHLSTNDDELSKMVKTAMIITAIAHKKEEKTPIIGCTPSANQAVKINYNTGKSSLVRFSTHGGNAQKKYIECCDLFGWDITEKNKFGNMQPLYARAATAEGYSPWFLAHSNLTNTKGGSWQNRIEGDRIFEKWLSVSYDMWYDTTTRVVFVKKGSNYIFLGVYTTVGVEQDEDGSYTKVYKLKSEVYPEINE